MLALHSCCSHYFAPSQQPFLLVWTAFNRPARVQTMESLSQDLHVIRPGALTGSRRDHRGAVGATLIRLSGLSTKEAAVTESVTLRTGTARRRPPDEASGSDTDAAEEEEEDEVGSDSDQEHVPGQVCDCHVVTAPCWCDRVSRPRLVAACEWMLAVAASCPTFEAHGCSSEFSAPCDLMPHPYALYR